MKICIVTHPLFHNYGGTLQAFALQESLRRLGHEPITIDYLPDNITITRYLLSQLKTLFYYLTFRTSRKFFKYPHRIRSYKFQNFMDEHITLTKRVRKYKVSILRKYNAEAIIVGSDQVWRGAYHNSFTQPELFLKFAKHYNVPKIAYAASFGVDYWEYSDKMTKECSELSKLFKAISTREDSGVELCRKYLGVNAVGVSDPTLLLDKEDYDYICKNVNKRKDKYLLAYLLDITEEQKKLISIFARKIGLDVLFCTSEKNIEYSVEEWLALYRDASFVITNSFHGTVFSIINNKDFYSVVHENRGKDRFVSLLSRFGLENRLIDDFKNIAETIVNIDWNAVNKGKKEWKDKSLDFLKTNLK